MSILNLLIIWNYWIYTIIYIYKAVLSTIFLWWVTPRSSSLIISTVWRYSSHLRLFSSIYFFPKFASFIHILPYSQDHFPHDLPTCFSIFFLICFLTVSTLILRRSLLPSILFMRPYQRNLFDFIDFAMSCYFKISYLRNPSFFTSGCRGWWCHCLITILRLFLPETVCTTFLHSFPFSSRICVTSYSRSYEVYLFYFAHTPTT